LLAYATGLLLIAFGIGMFVRKYASAAAALCGLLMLLLTVALYLPQFFPAVSVQQRVTAINFIFDTLLFAGTVLVISKAILGGAPAGKGMHVERRAERVTRGGNRGECADGDRRRRR
jgi:hypothetical protein